MKVINIVMQALPCIMLFQALAKQGSDTVREVAAGDAAYASFDNPAALQHFLAALKHNSSDFQSLWKGARAYADVGKNFEKSEKEKARMLYQRGDSLARLAVKFHPDSADAHFALALCVGRVALFEGGKTKIRLSKEVKQEAEKALALNPNHEAAYHVLGRWHYGVSTLSWTLKAVAKIVYGGVPPGASLEEAAKMYTKAIAIDGTKPVHRLEYGRTLIALKQYSKAREQLEQCLALPQQQWEDPAHKKEAVELLKEIAGKGEGPSRK